MKFKNARKYFSFRIGNNQGIMGLLIHFLQYEKPNHGLKKVAHHIISQKGKLFGYLKNVNNNL